MGRMPKKIKEALERGDAILWDDLFASYPKERQERILREARYLRAAMKLRRLRKRLKLSQEELAEKMDVRREFIARIESGRQNVTLETLYKIAEATGKEFEFHFR